jgi:uncharacterized RDD family membrane protein YckC
MGLISLTANLLPALVVGSLYQFVLESLWGATLGGMLFRLRVRSADGARAPWRRILIRTGIGFAVGALPILSWRIAEAAGYGAWLQTHGPLFSTLSSMVSLGITASMFLTARRENGYASLYDMISGTRVRVRPAERGRRVGLATAPSSAEISEDLLDEHIGPFTVVAAIGTRGPEGSLRGTTRCCAAACGFERSRREHRPLLRPGAILRA